MRRGAINLTPEQIEEAKELFADGWTCVRIADRIGCDYKTIKLAVDKEYAEFRRHQVNVARQRRYKPGQRIAGRENASGASVKEDAAARLAEIPKDTRSLTGLLAGDPLPGRSALDKRQPA